MTNEQRNNILTTLDGFTGLWLDNTITEAEYHSLTANLAKVLKTKNIEISEA